MQQMEQEIRSRCSSKTHRHLPWLSCYLLDLQTLELNVQHFFYRATTITGATYKVDQSDCRKKYEFIPRKLIVNHNRNKQHGSKSTNDNLQTWPLEPAEESPCFLRGRLLWVTEAKSVNIGYNFDLRSHIISKRGNGKCWWKTKYQLVSNI